MELNCAKTINRIVTGDTDNLSDEERKMVDACLRGLKTVSTNRQTTTARMALNFSMVSAIADKESMARYIQTTNPAIPKAIKGG